MNKRKFVNSRFAKSKEYAQTIKEIAKAGYCPFCPENFKYHKHPILKKEGSWFITKNSHPYENSRHHFLIIGECHCESLLDLKPDNWVSVQKLVEYAEKKFKFKGAALCVRFGDTNCTGATVSHLHFHLIIPKMKKGRSLTVNFPVG